MNSVCRTKMWRACQAAEAMAEEPDRISDATWQAAAVKSRNGSDRGACQILLGGPPVPPGPETDAKIANLFITEKPTATERSELLDGLDAAQRTTKRMKFGPCQVCGQVASSSRDRAQWFPKQLHCSDPHTP